MTQQENHQPVSPQVDSFATRLYNFYKTLPADEQPLLEYLCALAEAAETSNEVSGYRLGLALAEITVNCGTGMSKAFYEWIKPSSR